MRRIVLPVFLSIALLAPAQAEARGFPAQCHLEGTVTFSPPLTGSLARGSGFARARGTCDGRPATYVAWNSGLVSCSEGVARGGGYLRLRHRRKLRFRLTEHRAVAAAALQLRGARGGRAIGVAAASADADPVAIAQACLGPGLRSSTVEIDLRAASR